MSDRISTWCDMQRRVWHSDEGVKARTITLKRADTDAIIFSCDVETDNVADLLRQALQMQADELPKGSHRFMLIATDRDGKQLSELPQTVKGSSTEATTAAHEQIALARAHAQALSNVDSVNQILQRNAEQINEKYGSLIEDRQALLDKMAEISSKNFRDELELTRFLRGQQRLDTLIENLAPAMNLLAQWAVEKVLEKNPELATKLAGAANAATTTKKPSDASGPSLAKPGTAAVQRNPGPGGQGNPGRAPA